MRPHLFWDQFGISLYLFRKDNCLELIGQSANTTSIGYVLNRVSTRSNEITSRRGVRRKTAIERPHTRKIAECIWTQRVGKTQFILHAYVVYVASTNAISKFMATGPLSILVDVPWKWTRCVSVRWTSATFYRSYCPVPVGHIVRAVHLITSRYILWVLTAFCLPIFLTCSPFPQV